MRVVLISPPIAKACEPSLGVATLKGFLQAHGVPTTCIDANAEAQDWLLDVDRLDAGVDRLLRHQGPAARATRVARSWPSLRRRLPRLLADLRSPAGYTSVDKYRTTVTSLNRAMALASACHDPEDGSPISASLSDYLDARVCDMASRSVLQATREPERNLFYDYYSDVLIPRVAAMRPTVVGVSLIFRNQLLCGLVLAAMLKDALPDAHITVGGELISAWAEHLERTHLADIADSVIPYEGELPLLALARGTPLRDVPNILFRDPDGTFHRNPTRKVATLAEVPTPDYEDAPWHLYFAPERTAPVVSARGCYWNRCTFCPEVVNPESRLRIAQVADLTRQLDEVHQAHGVTTFHFIDSALPARTLRGVADHVIAHDLPYRWYGFSRLEPYLFKDGFAQTLRDGGCRMLMLGLETGSQRLLDLMDKKQDIAVVGRVLRSLRAAGVLVHAYLMFGTPHETHDDAELTRRFVAEHHDAIQFLNCSLMNLAKGSPMGLAPTEHGVTRVMPFQVEGHDLDLALYDNFDSVGWDRPSARRYLERAFLRDPAIRPAHLRTPPHFDANHSVFLHPLVFRGAGARGVEPGPNVVGPELLGRP